jgi:signal transduction histidine kinase
MAELADLGRGLYPPALACAELADALADMANRSPVPTTLQITRDLQALPDELRATVWFVCSEALTNVARHAGATSAAVTVRIDPSDVLIEIWDNGRGGATPTRGLRGLADRVETSAGTFTIDSPAGGPTAVRARLPCRGRVSGASRVTGDMT